METGFLIQDLTIEWTKPFSRSQNLQDTHENDLLILKKIVDFRLD